MGYVEVDKCFIVIYRVWIKKCLLNVISTHSFIEILDIVGIPNQMCLTNSTMEL